MNRKMICLLLAFVLAISLLACGKKQEKDPTIPAAAENAEATAAATDASGKVIDPTETTAQGEKDMETEGEDNTKKENALVEEATPAGGNQGTLPPDVEVSMGVVEGEGSSDIDEDFDDVPAATTPATQPTTPVTQPTEGENQVDNDFDITTLTYESYNAMSGEDQKKVIDMFGSTDDFMRWYKAVEAKYKAEHPDIEIGGGSVNAGDIAG